MNTTRSTAGDGKLVVIPLGVGDAFSAKWYSSAFAVGAIGPRGETHWVLLDCPHPIRKMLAEATASAPLDIPDFDAVVLTHLHGDHVSGLESYGFFNHFALQKRTQVLCHPSGSARLWPHHLAAGMDQLLREGGGVSAMKANDFFDFTALSTSSPVRFGPFTFESKMTVHHVPTTALRISAYGKTLGFSADTAFDVELLDWLFDGTDLVFHETNLGTHTPYEKLAALDDNRRAMMRLYHYPDFFDVDASTIRCLVPGERIEVGG